MSLIKALNGTTSIPPKPSNSGDAIAVLRVAWASAGKKLSFQQACEELLNVTSRQSSTYVHPGLIIPDIVPAHVSAGPPPIAIQGAEESALAAHQALIQSPDLTPTPVAAARRRPDNGGAIRCRLRSG
jgi:hypothetical protein